MVFLWRIAEGWPVEFVSDNVKRVLGYTAREFTSGRVSWPGITHPDPYTAVTLRGRKMLEAAVPAPVHKILMNLGLIDDPNVGLNSLKAR